MTHVDRDRGEWAREQQFSSRENAVREQIEDLTIGQFKVKDLGPIIRVFRLSGDVMDDATMEDVVQLEERIREIKELSPTS